MPTYEYQCLKCGHTFEKFQPIADPSLTVCAKDRCKLKNWGKGKVKRVISAGGGLIFKGSGFYITDYRSDKYKEAAKKDTPGGATEKKSGSGESTAPSTSSTPPAAPATPAKTAKPKPGE